MNNSELSYVTDMSICDISDDVYKEKGYKSREDYFMSLSEEYGVDIDTVRLIAYIMGPVEDFDGLVCTLDDYELWEILQTE